VTLRELRRGRLMTQAQLARKARVAQRTVTGIELGLVRARMETRRALLIALGLPLEVHERVFGPLPETGAGARRRKTHDGGPVGACAQRAALPGAVNAGPSS
jgi:transcriptional regulator with XRE-family HTH domain